jgi:acetyl esterase/lipase
MKYLKNRVGLTAFLILCIAHLFAQPGKANTRNINRKWLDIPYATLSSAQKLDIYLPEEGEGPFPVILAIHGGAFMMGDKADEQLNPMLNGLKYGYAVVSINYRMSGEALFPKNINDVKAAIRFIRANTRQYYFNPDKIAVWGGSAGGNLSALAGTSADVKELEDLSQGNEAQSCRVNAVVDWFGPTNFLLMDEELKTSGNGIPNHGEVNSPESKVLGQKISEIPGKVALANPETYITKDDPPFLIMHGTKDQLVPTQQSILFAEKLAKIIGKNKVTLHLLEGARHGGPAFEEPAIIQMVFDFLDRNLK